ncbi:THUMP domain-containing protein [Arthrospira platensis SPKY1]|nr:THUMP domain-containing protein [Arthrospira platensis SPKY1]
MVQLWHGGYRSEQDLYRAASEVAWEVWFTPAQTIKVEITAQHSPLTSLNFAALRIKDAICDRFRERRGKDPVWTPITRRCASMPIWGPKH